MLVPNGGSIEHLGATVTEGGVNFAVYSESATAIFVSIYDEQDQETDRFELDVHQDHIRAGLIAGLGAGTRYGLRADGPYDPDQGYFFDPMKLLVDARRGCGWIVPRRSIPRH
jgi:glycogen operon protein